MKYYIYCCFLMMGLVSCVEGFAQQRSFKVSGQVVNGTGAKNVCFLDENSNSFGTSEITDGRFEFSGTYDPAEAPFFKIILTDKDSIRRTDFVQSRGLVKLLQKVYYEKEVKLVYDVKMASWSIDGHKENQLYSVFLKNTQKSRLKIDSSDRALEKENIGVELKTEKKLKVNQAIYRLQRMEDVKLMTANPKSMVSLAELWEYPFMAYLPAAECRRIFSSFSDSLRNTPYGKRLDKRVADYELNAKPVYPKAKLEIDQIMYPFSLKNMDDQLVKSTDVYKDYTLNDFWASWCIPCRKQVPALKFAAEKFGDKGFRIISISIDKNKDINKWKAAVVVEEMLDFINLFDPEAKEGIGKELNITAIPANYLVDGKGKIIGVNLTEDELMQVLEKRYKGS